MKKIIPYGRHFIDKDDIENVVRVLKSGSITQGPKIVEFEKKISKFVKSKYAVAVSSCTAGLHLSLLATGIKDKKKVITSPITFVSTANSIRFCGNKIILEDVDHENFNLSIEKLKNKIKKNNIKFDAIIPVHFAGNPFDTKKLRKLVGQNKVIIEDAAHALGAKYKDGTMVGSCRYANTTVFSLHPVKTIACGEGGVVTTNDKSIYKKLLRLRSHGINKLDDKFINKKNAFSKGILNPWYYEMQELGYHYRMTEIQASLGISQLKKINNFLKRRKQLAKNYFKLLSENKVNFSSMFSKLNPNSSHHLFIININNKKVTKSRAEIMHDLKKMGIITQVHYIPIPMQPFYSKNFSMRDYPHSKKYYESCLSIPLFYSLTNKEQRYVFNCLNKIIK